MIVLIISLLYLNVLSGPDLFIEMALQNLLKHLRNIYLLFVLLIHFCIDKYIYIYFTYACTLKVSHVKCKYFLCQIL